MERINLCHCCSSIHMLQTTTTKRPPSLTLSGARIFKQRLATIRKHCIGSQEPGARVQWTKFSWKYDFPTFSEIILLLLYANKNFRIPNLLATLFRPWLKMSPFRYFSCTSNNSEVKPDLGADQLKKTNKTWDTSRLACDKNSIFFCHTGVPPSPGKWPNCVQMLYPAVTRFDCHKHWIFYQARFGGLMKSNCGSNVLK